MKIETFILRGWEDPETGYVIEENEEWVLVKHIPVDYVIDGYKLYRKFYIESREAPEDAEQIARVLQLKNVKGNKPSTFQFLDTVGLLLWVESRYDLFEFQDEEQEELFYGKIHQVEKDRLTIDLVHADGREEPAYDNEFELSEIRSITFESDYHLSMCLLWKDRLKADGL